MARLLGTLWEHAFLLASMSVFWGLSGTVLESGMLRVLAMLLFGVLVFNALQIFQWMFGGVFGWLARNPIPAILVGGLVGVTTPTVPLLVIVALVCFFLWLIWYLLCGLCRVAMFLEGVILKGVCSRRLCYRCCKRWVTDLPPQPSSDLEAATSSTIVVTAAADHTAQQPPSDTPATIQPSIADVPPSFTIGGIVYTRQDKN